MDKPHIKKTDGLYIVINVHTATIETYDNFRKACNFTYWMNYYRHNARK